MTSNSSPEPNSNSQEQQRTHHETSLWNSAKILENLFNSGKLIDDRANLTTKLTQLPQEAIRNLHQSQSESEILTTAVEEARRIIDCDRVLIYSPPELSPGKVIAEAVMPGWRTALGSTIEDPFLAPKYVEKYQKGHPKLIKNIQKAGITKQQLKPLERFQIKAMLVVPIWQKNKLFGLLVAHQCSETRQWQSAEVKYLEQITTLVRVALERKQLIEEKEQLQQQVDNEAQWTQFFNEAIPYIYKCFQEKDILKATVREIRRLLNCDRVVVYSLNQDDYGAVVAESVTSEFTKALGRVIQDPCFEARYMEKYQYGRVRAIDNIYEAGITECYLEQLEKLEVKANLVTPILIEDKIFGLLVAHQCSAPRQWKQYEIRWLTQVALQVGCALNNGQLLTRSVDRQQQQTNQIQWMELLRELTAYLRQSSEQADLLEKTVKEARRILNCERVVVYSLSQDQYGKVVYESVAPGLLKALGKLIKDPCFESKYLAKYEYGRVKAINNIYEAGLTSCYLEQLEKLEVKANLVTPIVVEGKIFGLLVAHHCHAPHPWQSAEIDFLSQLAHHVGLELERTQLIAERDLLRKRSATEAEWTELFTQTVQYIHQSLTEKDILAIAVDEIRRVFDCDRVVIYGLNQDRHGEVIAESVALGWTKALGRVIHDPCFEFRYLEKYQNGLVTSIPNVYEAGLTSCYLEQLEKLEVKANLVTPILNEGKIFGLLVAHQCSEPRQWKQHEIRWVTQISTQIGFALDNAQLLQQVEQSALTVNYLTHQQQQQAEVFKQHQIGILTSSTNTYEALAQDTLSQSKSLIAILHQIKAINDTVSNQAVNIHQVQEQKQQQSSNLHSLSKNIDLTKDNLVSLETALQEANKKIHYLSNSSQKMLGIVHLIQDFAKQIAQQSLNMTIAVSRSESADQDPMVELADTLLSLVQKLYKAIAQLNPLLSVIDTEAGQGKIEIDAALTQAVNGTEIVQDIQQNLAQIVAVNAAMSDLFAQFAQASHRQTQISTSTGESVSKVINLTNRISEHSSSLTESFQELASLTQEL